MFVTATGSTDHSDDHVDPDCTANGQKELSSEESGGRGDLGLHQRHLLGQDWHPHTEQDDRRALVVERQGGGAGHWQEELCEQLRQDDPRVGGVEQGGLPLLQR